MSLLSGRLRASFLIIAIFSKVLLAKSYFVSPGGKDTHDGSIDKPFASLQHVNTLVKAGDVVYLRGGVYHIKSKDIARMEGDTFAKVIYFKESGRENAPITYTAYQKEKVVFDFSEVKPQGRRVYAFSVSASWLHFKAIEVMGVQVTMKGHTQSICFENNGSHNIYERLTMRDGQAIGFYSVQGSHNLVLNCDAYNNWDDTSEDRRGGNVDGFGFHPKKGGKGNVLRGCRAWFNSDDGYDLISAHEAVVIDNCWAIYNGWSPEFKALGDGNGFKAGGYGNMPISRLPDVIPRHIVKNSFAMGNKQSGFYANHHIGGIDWIGNLAYQNKKNFNMLSRRADNVTDVPGYGHFLEGNVGVASKTGFELIHIDVSKCHLKDNSFSIEKTLSAKIKSFDKKQFFKPRQANGDLPIVDWSILKIDSES